jgi:16S rRNA processing protein RimM
MPLKLIGRIAGIIGSEGSLFVKDVPKGTPLIPEKTIINIGFSEKFLKSFSVLTWKRENKGVNLSLQGINSEESAGKLKEMGIFIDNHTFTDILNANRNDPELYGAVVIDILTKEKIGSIKEVWELPANDVWLLDTENGDLPIPVIDDVVKIIDMKNNLVEINVIPGLLELTDNTMEE